MKIPTFIALISLMTAAVCRGQQSLQVTGSFCVNKTTGQIKDQLTSTGSVKPCPKSQLAINLQSIPQLPAAVIAPSFQVRRSLQTSHVAMAAQNQFPPLVVDSTGKEVGIFIGYDYSGDAYAEMTFSGTTVEVPVNSAGFVQVPNIQTFFAIADCSSAPLFWIQASGYGLEEGDAGLGIGVGTDIGGGGYYNPSGGTVGNTFYYGAVPFANTPMFPNGVVSTVEPNNLQQILANTNCSPIQAEFFGEITDQTTGTPASADLSAFTPPFSIEW